MFSNVKDFINTRKNKAISLIAAGNAALVARSSQISALASNAQAKDVVQNVINLVLQIFQYIGVLLLVWSVGMLVLAFKNEDADSKSRAMMMLVVSAALIGLKPLLQKVLQGTGFSV